MAAPFPHLRAFAVFLALGPMLGAQQESAPPLDRATPSTILIDLQKKTQKRGDWPVWMESVEFQDDFDADLQPSGRVVRLRFRRYSSLNRFLLLRLQFLDAPKTAPAVSAWSEGGDCIFDSNLLGSGTGLNRMERLTLPMQKVDYIEIAVPGAGANLRSVALVSMSEASVLAPVDFAEKVPMTIDPFAPATDQETPVTDESLLGRVTATLLDHEVVLRPEEGGAALEFELEGPPMLAVLRLKVLNVDPAHPPRVAVNNTPVGALSLHLPDLADPGFRGSMRSLRNGATVRYAGWMTAEIVLPGAYLAGGVNRLDLQLPLNEEPLAVRDVELQLKYNHPTFDYDLSPAPIP